MFPITIYFLVYLLGFVYSSFNLQIITQQCLGGYKQKTQTKNDQCIASAFSAINKKSNLIK
jgi:hypothetical protein